MFLPNKPRHFLHLPGLVVLELLSSHLCHFEKKFFLTRKDQNITATKF